MRLLVARCEVRYSGRLAAFLADSLRLIVFKADGSVLVHADAGIDKSGGNIDREGLQTILRRVEGKESGGVVVSYLSRFSRDTVQGLSLLDRITAAGGAVYAPNLPDYTSPDGRMLTTIQLAIDAGYRDRKGAELERAKERAIMNGIPVITRPAVGLRQRKDRRLEPDPTVAPTIRAVFERRAQGAGPGELAEILEGAGVRTSQGSATWSKEALYGLLRNRIYMGELSYGRDRRYVNPDAVKPIVDLALWMAAQHPNGRHLSRAQPDTALLSGLLRCHACGYCLQATTSSHGHRIYRCTRKHAGGECPEPVRKRAEPIEDAVVDAFWSMQADLEARGHRDPGPDIGKLEQALAVAETRLEQWTSPEVQDAIGDPALYAAGLRERREARDAAAAELAAAKVSGSGTVELQSVETLRSARTYPRTQSRRMRCPRLRGRPR
jgi:DNA invertase Pin-like site-specific DNA recombinase